MPFVILDLIEDLRLTGMIKDLKKAAINRGLFYVKFAIATQKMYNLGRR